MLLFFILVFYCLPTISFADDVTIDGLLVEVTKVVVAVNPALTDVEVGFISSSLRSSGLSELDINTLVNESLD